MEQRRERDRQERPCVESVRWVARMVVLFATLLLFPAVAAAEAPAEEPSDYRTDDYRSPVPTTLRGVRVINPDTALALWKEGHALFLDVLPRPRKPENLPAGTIWRDKPRTSIPSAVWLPNVGYGKLNNDLDTYFRRSLEALTGGNKSKALVFFCQANCWMSWNAAKRAHEEYGYSDVTWFPEGTDGWPILEAPLVEVLPRS
jgi:PQQ-dependent catabolism-associated CXXCW motif protein